MHKLKRILDKKFSTDKAVAPRKGPGGWVMVVNHGTKWNNTWQFKCSKTGLTAIAHFYGSDPRPLLKLMESPGLIAGGKYNDCIRIADDKNRIVAEWRVSDGKLTVKDSYERTIHDGLYGEIDGEVVYTTNKAKKRINDTVVKAGYGLRQAMRMAFLVLAEAGLLEDEQTGKNSANE